MIELYGYDYFLFFMLNIRFVLLKKKNFSVVLLLVVVFWIIVCGVVFIGYLGYGIY